MRKRVFRGDDLKIDVRWLRRQGGLTAGFQGELHWKRDDEPFGSLAYTVEDSRVVLSYWARLGNAPREAVTQDIFLTWTPCNYGGRRPWFVCRCRKRVAILYAIGKYFLCRHCYNLVHASVNEGKRTRAYRKMLKIRRRLGCDDNVWETHLVKPKGMPPATFRQLLDKYEAAGEVYFQPLLKGFLRFVRKVGPPLCE